MHIDTTHWGLSFLPVIICVGKKKKDISTEYSHRHAITVPHFFCFVV